MSAECKPSPTEALIKRANMAACDFREATIIESSCPELASSPEYRRQMAVKNHWGKVEAILLKKAANLGVLDQVRLHLTNKDETLFPKISPSPASFAYRSPISELITPQIRAELWQKTVKLMPDIVNDDPLRQIRFSST